MTTRDRPGPAGVGRVGAGRAGAGRDATAQAAPGPSGSIRLDAGTCTSCLACVRDCPDRCITIESHREQVGEPGARRPRTVAVLDRFDIDWGLCMFCGICIEVCPVDALAWSAEPIPAAGSPAGLVHDRERLRDR